MTDQVSKQLLTNFAVSLENARADNHLLLKAVQAAYRKHYTGDDSIGWSELSDILHNALFNTMGAEKLEQWKREVKDND